MVSGLFGSVLFYKNPTIEPRSVKRSTEIIGSNNFVRHGALEKSEACKESTICRKIIRFETAQSMLI